MQLHIDNTPARREGRAFIHDENALRCVFNGQSVAISHRNEMGTAAENAKFATLPFEIYHEQSPEYPTNMLTLVVKDKDAVGKITSAFGDSITILGGGDIDMTGFKKHPSRGGMAVTRAGLR